MDNNIFGNNLETFDFGTSRVGQREGYYMTICQTLRGKNHTYRVSFSRDVCNAVDGKELMQLRVVINKFSNEMMMVFLNSNDPKVLMFGRESTGQIRVHSKSLAHFLMQRLNIHGDNVSVKIELSPDVSNSNEYATFKVLKQL